LEKIFLEIKEQIKVKLIQKKQKIKKNRRKKENSEM
jgi:hypothetical protein